MGQSTDAILFYGYCWEEETELFGKDDAVVACQLLGVGFGHLTTNTRGLLCE